MDLLIEEKVIIKSKAVENFAPVHHKQLLTYL
jgi:GxxExxY protein